MIRHEYNIPFMDYSTDRLSDSKKYFYNTLHLDKVGAEFFTKKNLRLI